MSGSDSFRKLRRLITISDISPELQKSHGHAGTTREKGLQNGQCEKTLT